MLSSGLIFDLDNTLFDADQAYAVANAAALAASEGVLTLQGIAEARLIVKQRLPERHVAARNRWLYFKTALERARRYTLPLHLRVLAAYEETLTRDIARQWQQLGRAVLFERLKHLPRVIITNEGLRSQLLKLQAIDPGGSYFSDLITAEEFGVEKPNPSLLKAAVHRLGLRGEDILVVGDSYGDDIEPALALGLKALWSQEFAKDKVSHVAKAPIIHSLNEVAAHVV